MEGTLEFFAWVSSVHWWDGWLRNINKKFSECDTKVWKGVQVSLMFASRVYLRLSSRWFGIKSTVRSASDQKTTQVLPLLRHIRLPHEPRPANTEKKRTQKVKINFTAFYIFQTIKLMSSPLDLSSRALSMDFWYKWCCFFSYSFFLDHSFVQVLISVLCFIGVFRNKI